MTFEQAYEIFLNGTKEQERKAMWEYVKVCLTEKDLEIKSKEKRLSSGG